MPLRVGMTTRSRIRIDEHLPRFNCFGEAYRGTDETNQQKVILVEFEEPVTVMRRDTDGVPGIVQHELHQHLGATLLVFRQGGLRSLTEWFPSPPEGPVADPAEAKRRLIQVADLITQLEESQSRSFFYPYICASSLVTDDTGAVRLLGAGWDFEYNHPSFEFPPELAPYVDPVYKEMRQAPGQRKNVAPSEDAHRRRHMRYGFGVLAWEVATGREQHPEAEGGSLNLGLSGDWTNAEPFILACLGRAPHDPETPFVEVVRDALGAVALPPVDQPDTDDGLFVTDDPVTVPEPDPADSGDLFISSDPADQPLHDIPSATPIGTTEEPKKVAVALAIVLFLVGLGIGIGYFMFFGVDPLNPGETRDLRAQTKDLQVALAGSRAELARTRTDLALRRWVAEPANRRSIETELTRLAPDNINLKYFKLLASLGSDAPAADFATRVRALREEYAKKSSAPKDDPGAPRFKLRDLDALLAIASRRG